MGRDLACRAAHASKDLTRQARSAAAARKAAKAGRDGERFEALPHKVIDSAGWRAVSPTARALLIDIIRSAPNGSMVATDKYLRPRGWTSKGTITKCLRELLAAHLLVETRKGRLPNTAALFACTWRKLSSTNSDWDIDAGKFERGGYERPELTPREPNRSRTAVATKAIRAAAKARQAGYVPGPSIGPPFPPNQTVPRTTPFGDGPPHGPTASPGTTI